MQELFEKFQCECNKNSAALESAIAAGEAAGSDNAAAAGAGGEQQKQLTQDIKDEKAQRGAGDYFLCDAEWSGPLHMGLKPGDPLCTPSPGEETLQFESLVSGCR